MQANIVGVLVKRCLESIAYKLGYIHDRRYIHCDLHSENIVLGEIDLSIIPQPFTCDLGSAKSANSSQSKATSLGILPYIAAEVLVTHRLFRFTQKIRYAFFWHYHNGKPPSRGWLPGEHLIWQCALVMDYGLGQACPAQRQKRIRNGYFGQKF